MPRPPALLWVPAALVAAGTLLPVAYLLLRTVGGGAEAWELLARGRTLAIVGRSLLLAATVTGATVAIGVPLAWLTVRTDLPLRRAWSVLTALPLVIPSYVIAFVVIAALGPRGLLQGLLAGPFGVERLPEVYGFPGAALTLTLICFPYVLLGVRSALVRLDPGLEEAAHSLGRSSWATFWSVTLPLVRPAIAAGALLVGLYTLSDFGAVSLLRYETFTWAIYLQYQSSFDRTAAASLSTVLVAIAIAVLATEALTRGRAAYYRTTGAPRPAAMARLGRWRWPALAFCSLVVLFSLAAPLAVLGYWVARGLAAGEPLRLLWGPLANSLYASGLAALATVVAAFPIVLLAVRYRGAATGLLERATYVGFALPGIAVALSLVFFGANYLRPLYQSMALLVFAYLVLYLPTAVGAERVALLQVRPSLEEAARSLGRSPLRVLIAITLPLMLPGILAGGAMVFLLTMKELPATLILGPIGFKTLATSLWSAASEAFFSRAAASALLLILASSVPLAVLTLRRGR